MKSVSLVDKAIEASPLSVFLIYINFFPPVTMREWIYPYALGSLMAGVALFCLHRRLVILNRLLLGVDVYLLSGLIAGVFHLDNVNQLYGSLQASAMLFWMTLVCALSWLFSVAGCFGLPARNHPKFDVYSIIFLFACTVSTAGSWFFVGNRFLSELLPFVLLFVLYGFLYSRLASHTDCQELSK